MGPVFKVYQNRGVFLFLKLIFGGQGGEGGGGRKFSRKVAKVEKVAKTSWPVRLHLSIRPPRASPRAHLMAGALRLLNRQS